MAEAAGDSQPSRDAPEASAVFAALADVIYEASSVAEVYAGICVAATLVVPGCDHATVMVRQGDAHITIAASDEVARAIDDLERAVGDGPCLDAIEDEAAQIDSDLRTHSQWPALAARIVAETPVRGAMGFRLLADRRKVGALNLFADAPGVFDKESAQRGVVLAAFASVAANAVVQKEDASTLRHGLRSNREIGKAIGMLMILHDISEDDAFGLLRRTSQAMNVKLADIAADIVKRRGAS